MSVCRTVKMKLLSCNYHYRMLRFCLSFICYGKCTAMDCLISVNAFPLHDSRRVLKLRMASLMITISGHSVVAVPLGTEGRVDKAGKCVGSGVLASES